MSETAITVILTLVVIFATSSSGIAGWALIQVHKLTVAVAVLKESRRTSDDDIQEIKTDLTSLKTEVSEMKLQVVGLTSTIQSLCSKIEDLTVGN